MMTIITTKQTLIESIDSETVLQSISNLQREDILNHTKFLPDAIAEVHNESLLDINHLLMGISRNEEQLDFCNLLHAYESALPLIACKTTEVVSCITHLLDQAGNDLAIGGVFGSFAKFCQIDFQRSKDAISFILEDPEKYSSLAADAIIASSIHDAEWGLGQIRTMVKHENNRLRWQAYSAIGRITLTADQHPEIGCTLLEEGGKHEPDDSVKASILIAAISLGKKNPNIWDKVNCILSDILDTVHPDLLYHASHFLAFDKTDIPEITETILIKYLKNTGSKYVGVINNIDYLLARLAKEERHNLLEYLLETLLCCEKDIQITSFNSFSNDLITNNKEYLNKLVTKWLLSNEVNLCTAVSDLSHSVGGKDIELHADVSLTGGSDSKSLFLARKALGWVFTCPITVSSLILSLHVKTSVNTQEKLQQLLFDPLLISYPGELSDYFKNKSNNLIYKNICEHLLSQLETYQNALKGAHEIKELRAPHKNYEMYLKGLNKSMQKAQDDAPKPIFEQFCTVQHLLYGNSSITYIHDGNGEQHRSEMQMHAMSHSMEFPRLTGVDPEGLDYMLRAFRVGRLKDETNS